MKTSWEKTNQKFCYSLTSELSSFLSCHQSPFKEQTILLIRPMGEVFDIHVPSLSISSVKGDSSWSSLLSPGLIMYGEKERVVTLWILLGKTHLLKTVF